MRGVVEKVCTTTSVLSSFFESGLLLNTFQEGGAETVKEKVLASLAPIHFPCLPFEIRLIKARKHPVCIERFEIAVNINL
jgi:hypothetical protein